MSPNGMYHGDDVLNIGRVRHLTTAEVDAEIAAIQAGEITGEIGNGAAAAIASWWQAPRGHGYAFAQLSSTGRVRLEDLADDISGAYDTLSFSAPERRYLDYLATWALNHPSRTEG